MLLRLVSPPENNVSGHQIGELYEALGTPYTVKRYLMREVRRVKTGKKHSFQTFRFVPVVQNQGDD